MSLDLRAGRNSIQTAVLGICAATGPHIYEHRRNDFLLPRGGFKSGVGGLWLQVSCSPSTVDDQCLSVVSVQHFLCSCVTQD